MKRLHKISFCILFVILPVFNVLAFESLAVDKMEYERVTISNNLPSEIINLAQQTEESFGSLRGGDFPPGEDDSGIGEGKDPIGALPIVLIAATSGIYVLRKKRT